ncbi:type II toxin-antitoxin system RelE/ParE family toxin [Microcystis aeruginosa]|jgi:proteic killer suppression protein|uniref:Killer suppression protein n=1 Tax=Microcystis aeruginosa DA14 TaxID=1987506 RepID=A0A3E0MHA4_MICAE|nr:killer suppression protein [Microcystis aeruginosa]REJ59046.1 MAG: killer suppression protein [Microcystis aeruginosa DA14]WOB68845.1 killer suppression protein [Microcystis aeruginosa LE3]CCI06891.1 putative killer suppression protein [Microcystis aeruginosa PCC 7941]
MDIVFKEKKFENECNSQRLLKKQYGEKMAKKIRQRLDDLKAVIVLEEMRSLPGRCHELLHNRAGQLSLDLVHPLRLIFEPADIPIPQKADGGIDWKKVTAVVIIGIDDTHD